MKNPTVWSIYKNVRLSIQNSEATAFIAMSILEDLYDKGSTAGGAAYYCLAGNGGYKGKPGMHLESNCG
ncbi:MAG: hypothetical protein PVH37_05080 [Desulfobacterales bacterium]|jgi:hypothetical protein